MPFSKTEINELSLLWQHHAIEYIYDCLSLCLTRFLMHDVGDCHLVNWYLVSMPSYCMCNGIGCRCKMASHCHKPFACWSKHCDHCQLDSVWDTVDNFWVNKNVTFYLSITPLPSPSSKMITFVLMFSKMHLHVKPCPNNLFQQEIHQTKELEAVKMPFCCTGTLSGISTREGKLQQIVQTSPSCLQGLEFDLLSPYAVQIWNLAAWQVTKTLSNEPLVSSCDICLQALGCSWYLHKPKAEMQQSKLYNHGSCIEKPTASAMAI